MKDNKFCTYCGRAGHSAHQCLWPKDIPPLPPVPEEPIRIPSVEDDDWTEYYGGY